jgi:hypothetical protein
MDSHSETRTPFAGLLFKRSERGKELESLIATLIANELVFVIVDLRPPLFWRTSHYDSINIGKAKDCRIFCASESDQVPLAVDYLLKKKLWHAPAFHIVIGYRALIERIRSKLAASRRLSIEEIEEEADEDIVGFIDPLDDELICYGKSPFRDLVLALPAAEPI